MEIKASVKYFRLSPRKIREVASSCVGMPALKAIAQLKLEQKKAAKILVKLLQQGVANAKNNFKAEPGNLNIKSILVEEGPRLKRYDKSHGARFDSGVIRKKLSHIKLLLETKEKTEVNNKKEEKSPPLATSKEGPKEDKKKENGK